MREQFGVVVRPLKFSARPHFKRPWHHEQLCADGGRRHYASAALVRPRCPAPQLHR
jgi:hypothetical protein